MSREFTTEKFPNYTFKCFSGDANCGFTHNCTVEDEKGNELFTVSYTIGNRTWESYPFQVIYEMAQEKLRDIIAYGEFATIATDFLETLVDKEIIYDYGEDKNGDIILLYESYDADTEVLDKLKELAEKNLLKPQINFTILRAYTRCYDEYSRCDRCGRLFSTEWNELTETDDCEFLCDDCLKEDNDCIEDVIEKAKRSFRNAVPVAIPTEKIEELGYENLDSEMDFSTRYSQWGETSWGCHNTPLPLVEELCENYGGFAKLTGVYQFDAEFNLFFPKESIAQAKKAFEKM